MQDSPSVISLAADDIDFIIGLDQFTYFLAKNNYVNKFHYKACLCSFNSLPRLLNTQLQWAILGVCNMEALVLCGNCIDIVICMCKSCVFLNSFQCIRVNFVGS